MPVIIREFARRQVNELYKGRITLPQFFILNFLHENNESKMTDMACFMRVTTAAMTGLVERLVKSGYCQRVFDPGDRRLIKIRLTAKGQALVRKVNHQRQQMIVKIFGMISEGERNTYLRILMRIRDILLQEKEEK
jgi:DNA-binding MarR family transcriptional regulator